LSIVPQEEMEKWASLAERYDGRLGEFVQVSPFIAELMKGGDIAPSFSDRQAVRNRANNSLAEIVGTIRVTAARQHLDAVLIYEVYGKSDVDTNLLQIADLSIIGAFLLPSRKVTAVGHAQALLVDVRNGYPYGTASTTVDDHTYTTSASLSRTRTNTDTATKTAAALQLIDEIEPMMDRLEVEITSLPQTAKEKTE